MKKHLIALTEAQIDRLTKSKNAMTAEEASAAEETINKLKEIIEAAKADDGDVTAVEALKAANDELKKQIEALAEKITKEPEMEPKSENYLKSTNALHDWCQAVRSNNQMGFRAMWGDSLRKNNITFTSGSEGAFMPEAVKGEIQDAWEKPGNWLNMLNNTKAKMFNVRRNTSDQAEETSRAKGHVKGDTKAVETLNFEAKLVQAQMIYKIIDLDNMTIWNDDEALMRYIVNELMNQWLIEIERAILVGDGRLSNSPYKVSSVEAIVRSSTDAFVTVSTHSASNELKDELVQMVSDIKVEGEPIVMFMKRSDVNSLRRYSAGTGATPVYQPIQSIADEIGVSQIIVTDLIGSGYKAIAFCPSKYVTVGSLKPEMVQWEDYLTNKTYTRLEIPFGGAVEGVKSASVLKAE